MDSLPTHECGMSTLNSDAMSKWPTITHDSGDDRNDRVDEIIQEAIMEEDTNSVTGSKALFFNYHEYTERYYADIDDPNQYREHTEDESISITHFPNVYAPRNSVEFMNTRLVRIPRRFESTLDTPYFSTQLPGHEPAAIRNNADGNNFVPHGIFDDGNVFGYSSISPLSMYITEDEFDEIMNNVNKLLKKGYETFSWINLIDIVIGVLTLGLWTWLSHYVLHRGSITTLENYIAELNGTELFQQNKIQIISPRKSGYLSLDFQIPKPTA